MKRKLTIILAAIAVFSLAACNKRCHCYDRNGANVYYTQDEVDAAGTSCANMVTQAGKTNYYYLCEWEL